jgi:hypothetical protein
MEQAKGTTQYIDKIQFSPKGKMDSDSDVRSVQKGDIIDALNSRWGVKNNGTVGSVENIKGNKLIPINLPVGNNKIVGTCEDRQMNKGIAFLYNDQNHHGILQIDILTETITPIMWDAPILNFDGQYINNPVVLDGVIYYTDVNGIHNVLIDKVQKYTLKAYNQGIGYWIISTDFIVQPN